MISALSALVVAGSVSTPAFCGPVANSPTFRAPAAQATTAQAQPALADDTLLVLLSPHSDTNKVKGYLRNESNSATIKDMHVNSDDYSILQVQPLAGREATLSKITGMMKSHSEIVSVSRNYKAHMVLNRVPNDPDFSQQWPLANQRWPRARVAFINSQQHRPHITILADGCDPVATNNELGAFITQYNALDPTINPFIEPVQGSAANGGGEGDVDTSITGCLTDNSTLMAGSGSFTSTLPCDEVMLRMTTGDSVAFANIYNALAWAVNNQSARGGMGPVNLSYGDAFPAPPLWSDPTIQSLATSLKNQGDLLVIAAGDTPGTEVGYPPGNAVVVQASDINNSLFTDLTLVQNDPIAAPGSVQPAVIGGMYNTDFEGTSFSAPHVCSLIAMILAVNPSLTSLQAYRIILATGTPVHGAEGTGSPLTHEPYPVVIPAWDLAIYEAIHFSHYRR